MERGYSYLQRFKNLSVAFATGDFKAVASGEKSIETTTGPWDKTPLYSKLNEAQLAITKLYKEIPKNELNDLTPAMKPLLYTSVAEAVKVITSC